MKLNRLIAKDLALKEPNKYVYYHYQDVPDSFVKEGIRWGRKDVVLSWQEIIRYWTAKKRATPIALMLAKMYHESSRNPYIALYEKGQHERNPDWKRFNEYQSTSYGLFQYLGLTLQGYGFKVPDENDVFSYLTIERQFDIFDAIMANILAKLKKQYPDASQDEWVWYAIAMYGLPALFTRKPTPTETYRMHVQGHIFNPKTVWGAVQANFNTYKAIMNQDTKTIEKAFGKG
ncbi:MAG: hypothetical protein RML94_02550, partial [Bacteroidia bacterium]|nr:hypothetical protein [Bacteroidia bacterium]